MSLIIFHKYLHLLLLIPPLLFIVFPLLKPGIVLYGDFPVIETSLYSDKFLSTWIDYGSHHGFETLSRYPIILLGYVLGSINVSSDIISKFLVVLGFFAASFSFYFSFRLLFKNKFNDHATAFKIAAILGSLFYAYNVWSFHRISHWYLWLGYAILPLFLISLVYAFNRNVGKWKYILLAVLTWSIASSTPHMAVFYGLFYVGLALYFIIKKGVNKKQQQRQNLIKLASPIVLTISLYFLVNLYWIYPYILYSGQETFIPGILVTQEQTATFSRDSNFLNVFRLIEDWWQPRTINVSPSDTSLLYPFWLFGSFVVPVIAFSALLISKRNLKYVLLFFIIGIVGILLTLGTKAPFNFYSILIFDIPLFSALKYLLRDPDKWAFLIALAYSFLLGIASFDFIRKIQIGKLGLISKNIIISCFLILILFSIILYSYPIYEDTSKKVLDPIILPTADYAKLNNYLTKKLNNDKVYYISHQSVPTSWSKGREVYGLDEKSSAKPSIIPYYPSFENYDRYLTYVIESNKSNSINNFIFPLGTPYIIFDNATLDKDNPDLLKKLSLVQGLKNTYTVGFFKIFNSTNSSSNNSSSSSNGIIDPTELGITKQNMILVGGLDSFASLNSVPSFSSINSSLFFVDQNLNKEKRYQTVNAGDYLLFTKDDNNNYNLELPFVDEKYVAEPFGSTNHYNPAEMWSKASTNDPWHGEFHDYLDTLGIGNWDFDYGKGLLMTSAIGKKLDIPLEVGGIDNNYNLFIRYMKNERGGSIKVNLDGNFVKEINSRDTKSNNFVWEKVNDLPLSLSKGRHNLELENVFGFNAVNVLALIPQGEMNKLKDIAQVLANKTINVYLLEAESNFHNSKLQQQQQQNSSVIRHYLFAKDNKNGTTSSFLNNIEGQFKVPPNANLLSLQFLARQSPQTSSSSNASSYTIKNLAILPSSFYNKQSIFMADFENRTYLDNISKQKWINNDPMFLSLSSNRNQSIKPSSSTSSSFRGINNNTADNSTVAVQVKQGNTTNWSIISTDFIPVNENTYYNYSMDVSTKDVHQLHSKVIYFDSAKNQIKSDFVFEGKDGSFEKRYSNNLPSPPGTKYIKLQMWIAPNPRLQSSYLIDDVKVLPQVFKNEGYQNGTFTSLETNSPISGNRSLRVDIRQNNSYTWSIISTDFIPVNENTYYNYSMDVSTKDVHQLHSKVIYFDSAKNQIKSDFVFEGKDGSFEKRYSNNLPSPPGTKYIKLQLFTSPEKSSSRYLVDNVQIQKITPTILLYKNSFGSFENANPEDQKMMIITNNTNNNTEKFLKTELLPSKSNSTNYKIIQTKPLPVVQNSTYNYTMSIEAQNLNSFRALVSFSGSKDLVTNSTKYGAIASNGKVVSLSPGSEVYTDLDILKPSNYTIALRAKTCESCDGSNSNSNGSVLALSVIEEDEDNNNKNIIKTSNISLKDIDHNIISPQQEFKWFYLNNTYLKKGKYEIKIHSNSQTDLDSVMLYSNNNNKSKDGEKLKGIFNINQSNSQYPARIADYKKINPTKFVVDVRNATRPYVMTFAESYDPLWIAYDTTTSKNSIANHNDDDNNFKTNSFPLYSIVNGFYINKTGDYTLTIEYEPQKWFIQAGIISIAALISIPLVILWMHQKGKKFQKINLKS